MALIGCGLMGGSFAMAVKKAGLVKRIVGYSKSPSTTNRARQMGAIDEEASSALIAVSGADLVILAIPVASTEPTLRTIKHLIQPDTLIMDVGSTKVDVVNAARSALKDRFGCFVPAHPITGKEVSGVEHADVNLYTDAQVVLTPTELTKVAQLRNAEAIWKAIGTHVTSMSPEAHDAALAASSHAPHLIAMAYMNAIVNQEDGHRILSLAGPGFRDFTRIAAGEPQMWRDIFSANKDEILKQVHHLQHMLGRYEAALTTNDLPAVEALVRGASDTRAHWKQGKLYTPQSLSKTKP
ncbi:MAG: prephenate dehydrogenase/arogenate dehydrogenase family protein [Comamonas sp.]